MNLELNDEQSELLIQELSEIIDNDRYFLGPPRQGAEGDPGEASAGARSRAPASTTAL